MHGPGFTAADAAAQADQAMKNARALLSEAGSGLEDVMKTRIYVGDRAYREAAYQAVGRHFGDVAPCSTGLIVGGFARPAILFEIDMAVIRSKGAPHRRLRRFHADEVYRDGQKLGMRFCQSVRAGNVVHLRGQTGFTLDGRFPFPGDPAAQADQAMRNVAVLLEEAGASLGDICKIHTYVLHRGHREAVYRALGRRLEGVHPCGADLIVDVTAEEGGEKLIARRRGGRRRRRGQFDRPPGGEGEQRGRRRGSGVPRSGPPLGGRCAR